MKVWSAIFNFIAVWVLIIMIVTFYRHLDILETDYETAVLRQAVEYATEAAFQRAVDEGEAAAYTNIENIRINPASILQTFETMMCLSYDMALTDLNKELVESSILSAILCTYDGYYITKPMSDSTPQLKWSLKIPYTIKVPKGGQTYTVALRMGSEQNFVIEDSVVKSYDRFGQTEIFETRAELGAGFSSDVLNIDIAKARISTIISQALAYNVYKVKEDVGGKRYRVYIPPETTITGINNIERPTLIILFEGESFIGKAQIPEVAMAGLTVIAKDWVIAYRDITGNKLYCHESKMLKTELDNFGLVQEDKFPTTLEAQQKGYYPDYVRMVRGHIIGYRDTQTNKKLYSFENQVYSEEVKKGIIVDIVEFSEEQDAINAGYILDDARIQR